MKPSWGLQSGPRRESLVGSTSPAGALLMLMVPDDPESGCLYIYDLSREAFYSLALPIDGRFGGFREDEFDGLCQTFELKTLASDPELLRV